MVIDNALTLWFAASALFFSAVSPLLMAVLTRRHRKADAESERKRKAEEDAHRNEVAAEALRIAQMLVSQSRRLNESTLHSVQKLTSTATHSRIIGNGVLTATIERELDAVRAAYRQMQESMQLKEDAGISPAPASLENYRAMERQIKFLEVELQSRYAAQAYAVHDEDEDIPPNRST